MKEQRTFASLDWNTKGKVTRRERFLAEMNEVTPWLRLVALIEPYYPKGGANAGIMTNLSSQFIQTQRYAAS